MRLGVTKIISGAQTGAGFLRERPRAPASELGVHIQAHLAFTGHLLISPPEEGQHLLPHRGGELRAGVIEPAGARFYFICLSR